MSAVVLETLSVGVQQTLVNSFWRSHPGFSIHCLIDFFSGLIDISLNLWWGNIHVTQCMYIVKLTQFPA